MSNQSKYRDKRQAFWRAQFQEAVSYASYLDQSEMIYVSRWQGMENNLPDLSSDQQQALQGHNRTLNILVSSGVWCGDCVRQGPILKIIADTIGHSADLRFVERGQSVELDEEFRILGALRVPVVVFLSEDFFEIGRFGDRMLSVYRRKSVRELGPACNPGIVAPPENELVAEITEWVDIFERMLLMARLSPPLRQRHGD